MKLVCVCVVAIACSSTAHETAPPRLLVDTPASSEITVAECIEAWNRALDLTRLQIEYSGETTVEIEKTRATYHCQHSGDHLGFDRAEYDCIMAATDYDAIRTCKQISDERPDFVRLDALKRSDLFSYFTLEADGPARRSGDDIVQDYHSLAARFRNRVTITITTRDDRVKALSLVMNRSFVDDEGTAFDAREITTVALQRAIPTLDGDVVEVLSDEIAYRDTNREGGKLPVMPSESYLAFVGQKPRHELPLPHGSLVLVNDSGKLAITIVNY